MWILGQAINGERKGTRDERVRLCEGAVIDAAFEEDYHSLANLEGVILSDRHLILQG